MPLENLQKERIKKLKNIQRLGVDSYPSKKRKSNESREEVEVTTPIVRYKCKILEIK